MDNTYKNHYEDIKSESQEEKRERLKTKSESKRQDIKQLDNSKEIEIVNGIKYSHSKYKR